jgi:hypothetical protein
MGGSEDGVIVSWHKHKHGTDVGVRKHHKSTCIILLS